MEFLQTDFTLQLNGTIIILMIIGLIVLAVLIFLYVSSLLQKIKKYQQPKYGFLGKPIYPVVAMSLLLAGLVYFNFGVTEDPVVDIKASKTINAQIVTLVGGEVDGERVVEFSAIPTVNDQPWGNANDSFDIFWTITGPETFDRFEFDKTGIDESMFTENLLPGTYHIKVTIVYDGNSYEFEDDFQL